MSAGIHHLHHKEQHPSKIRKRFPTISRKKIGSLGNLNLMGSRIISFFCIISTTYSRVINIIH
jgi:hypothetical protein